jgi:hypothetical protein
MRGIKIHPQDPLVFDFIVDAGRSGGMSDRAAFKAESGRLINYFLAALTIPESDLWVNLSPYEPQRVMPRHLDKTELGRDMLAQDYVLKQLTASLMYPEQSLGREFWDRIYARVHREFGAVNVPVDVFNKVWIVADRARARVVEYRQTAHIAEARLKVMLDQDYAAQRHGAVAGQAVDARVAQVIRDVIVPAVEKEVNEGAHFAVVRQMFHAVILAAWYKAAFREALLNRVYSDQGRTAGILSDDVGAKERIYMRYMRAFRQGVFNYIKEEPDVQTRELVARRYFSGGVVLAVKPEVAVASEPWRDAAMAAGSAVAVQARLVEVVSRGDDAAMSGIEFGSVHSQRVHDQLNQWSGEPGKVSVSDAWGRLLAQNGIQRVYIADWVKAGNIASVLEYTGSIHLTERTKYSSRGLYFLKDGDKLIVRYSENSRLLITSYTQEVFRQVIRVGERWGKGPYDRILGDALRRYAEGGFQVDEDVSVARVIKFLGMADLSRLGEGAVVRAAGVVAVHDLQKKTLHLSLNPEAQGKVFSGTEHTGTVNHALRGGGFDDVAGRWRGLVRHNGITELMIDTDVSADDIAVYLRSPVSKRLRGREPVTLGTLRFQTKGPELSVSRTTGGSLVFPTAYARTIFMELVRAGMSVHHRRAYSAVMGQFLQRNNLGIVDIKEGVTSADVTAFIDQEGLEGFSAEGRVARAGVTAQIDHDRRSITLASSAARPDSDSAQASPMNPVRVSNRVLRTDHWDGLTKASLVWTLLMLEVPRLMVVVGEYDSWERWLVSALSYVGVAASSVMASYETWQLLSMDEGREISPQDMQEMLRDFLGQRPWGPAVAASSEEAARTAFQGELMFWLEDSWISGGDLLTVSNEMMKAVIFSPDPSSGYTVALSMADAAMTGGIDLDPSSLALDIARDGHGFARAVDSAMVSALRDGRLDGFRAVIVSMTPVSRPLPALGPGFQAAGN